jgi:hypothetical protein
VCTHTGICKQGGSRGGRHNDVSYVLMLSTGAHFGLRVRAVQYEHEQLHSSET